jgi:hypothetical protein
MPIQWDEKKVRTDGKPLWAPGGKRVLVARTRNGDGTGKTKTEALEALVDDLDARAEEPALVWSPGGTLFMVTYFGPGCWGYRIIRRDNSWWSCSAVMGAKTREQAIEDAERHAAEYEE